MANPFISQAKQDFQATKGDLRAAFEAGDLTKQEFREAKGQAKDILGGFKEDVRGGTVSEYSNPFANFSYTPTGGISTLDTGATGVTTGTTGVTTGTVADTATGIATPTTSTWTPTAGDLYQNLNPKQERRFQNLAELYATGQLEGLDKKLSRLDKLLGLSGLGTRETYFSQDVGTYTDPTGLDIKLPENMTYQDIADIYRDNDPFRAYVASEQLGIDPQEALRLLGGYQTNYYNPVRTTTDIESLTSQGQSMYTDYSLALAYIKDPNAQMFVDNPGLASRAQQVVYAYQNPIDEPLTATTTKRSGKEVAGSGQYGYLNNAPVLNADIVDEILGDANRIGSKAFKRHDDILDELGWNFKSGEGLNQINRGVRIVGLNENAYTPDKLTAMDSGELYTDPDTGATIDTYAGERQALVTAAERIGIDPSKYESSADLYDAIEQATNGLYMVTGQYRNQWDSEQIAGIDDRGNHASVLYRKVGNVLVPIDDPNLFKYTKPKDPFIGGFVGEVLGSVPFLPEIAAMATGGNAYVYTALKTAQTAAQSGELSDVLKSGGLAWLASDFIPKTLGPYIQTEIGKLPFVQDLALTNEGLANYLIKGGTNAAIASGMAAITGQDPLEAGLAALASSGLFKITEAGIDMTSIPEQYRPVVARIVADIVVGRDIKNSMFDIAKSYIRDEVKDFTKTGGKQESAREIQA